MPKTPRSSRSAGTAGWAGQAAANGPHTLRRGMRASTQACAARPNLPTGAACAPAPQACGQAPPAWAAMSESADRRGMRASPPGIGRVATSADRRGMIANPEAGAVCSNQPTDEA